MRTLQKNRRRNRDSVDRRGNWLGALFRSSEMKRLLAVLLFAIACLMGALVIVAQDLGWAISLATCVVIIAAIALAYGGVENVK